jgi:hypothetical protein
MLRALGIAVFSLIFFLASTWAADEEKHLYMLSKPIEQSTILDKRLAYGIFGFDVIWSMGKGFLYTHLSHNRAAMSVIAWDLAVSQVPIYEVKSRLALETIAQWHRRKDLRDIAQVQGVNDIRIVTVAQPSKESKFFEKSLDSTSTVFVETSKPLQEQFKGQDWVELHPDDDPKWRFRLKIGGETIGQYDVPLEDVFNGTRLEKDLREQWNEAINGGKLSLPQHFVNAVKQHIPFKEHIPFMNPPIDSTIENVLVLNGKEVEKTRGLFAEGSAVDKLLGNAFMQRLNKAVWNDFFDYRFPDSKKIFAKRFKVVESADAPVISENRCLRTIQKTFEDNFAKTLKRHTP